VPVQPADNGTAAFRHKQDCARYVVTAQQQLSRYDESSSYPGWNTVSTLDRVFYSNSQNSCLYVWTSATYDSKNQHISDLLAVSDVLSGQRLMNVLATWGSPDYARFQREFDDELIKYE
jgi:hypothetical protein